MANDPALMLLWSAIVSSAAIALVLVLRGTLLARFGARLAHAAWSLVPIVTLVSMLPGGEQVGDVQRLVFDAPQPLVLPVVGAAGDTAAVAIDARPWLMAGWALGGIAYAIVLVRRQRRFVRSLGRLQDAGSGILRASSSTHAPALVGLLPARIVVPADFDARYDQDQREMILRHERVHRARGDHWCNAFASLWQCVFWFNPLMHAAVSRFRRDQEMACDACVVDGCSPCQRRAYASAMLDAESGSTPLPAGCTWRSVHPLVERVGMLRHGDVAPIRHRLGVAMVAVLTASASFVAWSTQPATPSQQIAVELTFAASGRAGTPDVSTRRALLAVGAPLVVSVGEGASRKELEITFQPSADGAIEARGVVRDNGIVVSSPSLVFMPGRSASMRMGEPGAEPIWTLEVAARFVGAATMGESEWSGNEAQATMPSAGSPPRYARISPPIQPKDDNGRSIGGRVHLDVLVGRDGMPLDIVRGRIEPEALHVALADRLADSAIAAVRVWTFEPAMRDGAPYEARVIVPIAFGAGVAADVAAAVDGDVTALDTIVVREP